ncbi:MAG: tetratricopeptide repeat protein [Nitrospiria bacterium]
MEFKFNENVYFYPLDSEAKQQAYEHFLKAYEHQMKGELDTAVALYKQSLEVFPTAEAHTFLGWTYSFMGLHDEAIEECHKAITTDPDFGNPYNDIGAYLIEQGQLEEAIPWLERATKAKRYESYYFPHFNLGRIWEKRGEWYLAMDAYRNALKENPNYGLATKALRRIQTMMN